MKLRLINERLMPPVIRTIHLSVEMRALYERIEKELAAINAPDTNMEVVVNLTPITETSAT
jgi:hypothetical protein